MCLLSAERDGGLRKRDESRAGLCPWSCGFGYRLDHKSHLFLPKYCLRFPARPGKLKGLLCGTAVKVLMIYI